MRGGNPAAGKTRAALVADGGDAAAAQELRWARAELPPAPASSSSSSGMLPAPAASGLLPFLIDAHLKFCWASDKLLTYQKQKLKLV